MLPIPVPSGSGLKVAVVCSFPSGKHSSAVKAAEAAEAVRLGADEIDMVIESAALTDDEIVGVCRAAVAARADFVKTSTGFHPSGGASVHAVELMYRTVHSEGLTVKASGGVRTLEQALAMIAAGATRLGRDTARRVGIARTARRGWARGGLRLLTPTRSAPSAAASVFTRC